MNEKQTDNSRIRTILVIIVFIVVIGGFFIMSRIITPPDISQSERRPLAKLPVLTSESFVSAKYMADFETWAADSFALRESLRTVRAKTVFRVFRLSDKDGLYIGDSGAGKIDKIREDSWRRSCQKICLLAERIKSENIYVALIPDKSIYAGKWMPGFDLDLANSILEEEMSGYHRIDLASVIKSEDFYQTDLHMSQTSLSGIMDALGAEMNFKPLTWSYVESIGDFFGVYTGQLALPMPPDTMTYVRQMEPYVDVKYLDPSDGQMKGGPLYDTEAFSGVDPYSFFLSGPQPLIVLELYGAPDNPFKSDNGRELILFRDSFGSSIAPLFIGAYQKITMIDLRYIDSRLLDEYVDVSADADVLFLYSSQILNNPDVLLIR